MADEKFCPTCGAPLKAGQACPFCAEARWLVAQLAEQEDVRLCARCGALLQPGEEEFCDRCRRTLRAQAMQVRREDRIARWLRERLVESPAEQVGLPCPACGQPMPPLAVFCPYCGHRVGQTPLAAQPTPTTVPQKWSDEGSSGGPLPSAPAEAAAGEMPADLEPPEADLADLAQGPGEARKVSWAERAWAFLRYQFQPFVEEWRRPGRPFGEQVRASWQRLFRPHPAGEGAPAWLWAMLFLILAGLVGMMIFWAYLLNSGVRFR